MKYINLDDLPRKGLKGKSIDWKNTVGYKCNFVYDDIEGEIEIMTCNHPYITLKYMGKLHTMRIDKFKNCQLGKAINKHTSKFKVALGTIFKDEMRDITIVDRKYKMGTHGYNVKYYKYHCNIDGNEDWVTESCLLTKNQGCNLCAGRKIVKGFNDIATTDPWMIKYFVNKKDVYKYAKCSGDFAKVRCPKCGYIKTMQISNLYQHGLSCNKCSSGFSYPNKFMLNLLEQLNVEFIPEYSPEWIKPRRYDFYIPSKNLIIEMDGGWHYNDNNLSGLSREEIYSIDEYKNNIANSHKIDLVRINCDYGNINKRCEFIKNNILSSKLTNYFNFDNLNWTQIDINSMDDFLGNLCNSFKKLANKFNMDTNELLEYINIGKENGLIK